MVISPCVEGCRNKYLLVVSSFENLYLDLNPGQPHAQLELEERYAYTSSTFEVYHIQDDKMTKSTVRKTTSYTKQVFISHLFFWLLS